MARRLVLVFLALTAVVLAVLELPLGIRVAEGEEDQLLSDLQRDAFALASFSEDVMEGRDGPDLQGVADEYQARTGARVVFVAADGSVLADSDPLPGSDPDRTFVGREEIDAALAGDVVTGSRASASLGTDLVYAAVPVASGGAVHGAVRVSYPREEVDARIRRSWLALGGIAVVALLFATGLGVLLGRWTTRPLRVLERSSSALGAGELGARAPADRGPPEVRRLAGTFNDMAARLEELVGAQESFVADASHQLRTPLTALRLRIENVAADPSGPTAADLEAALAEADRLARLVDGLLALARADRASSQATAESLPVGPALAERADVWGTVGDELTVEVVAEPSDAVVRAGEDRLSQVLDNLVANALDAVATRGGGRVRLWTAAEDGTVAIHVTDDGPGLAAEDRERAFDRFWRAGGDRSESTLGGTGLGLAICRKLVAADGGTIELRAVAPHGVDAVVCYPAAELFSGPTPAPSAPRLGVSTRP